MSFLDVDEWLIELAGLVDIVYSPIIDVKEYPENVDIAIVEGAVANEDNLEILLKIRQRTKVLIAFGDCAVTGNVTAMRNPLGSATEILQSIYVDRPEIGGQIPSRAHIVPVLLEQVKPLHEVVTVDAYMHGCPPSAKSIRRAVEEALAGLVGEINETPELFG
jgi:NAD-reducing hydrogenase small subunit